MNNGMDADECLIEEVRNRTILYDLGHSDYKNLKRKEYEWRAVSAVVKLKELDCKKRWKVLRDSYKRCKRMEQIASGSGAGVPKKKWKYFDAMSFLDSYTSSRRTVGNTICSDVSEPAEEFVDTKSTDLFQIVDTECSTSSPGEKKKKDSERFQEFLSLASTSISDTCGAFAATRKEDSTSAHFLSLAAKIREAEMPPNIVNEIESKVSNLVFSEIQKFYSRIEYI